jgi:hypothetical protein
MLNDIEYLSKKGKMRKKLYINDLKLFYISFESDAYYQEEHKE